MKGSRATLIIILLLIASLRALYIAFGPFDLSPDEAHYWEWSRRLDFSYYSKGPLVAYVIAFFTSIFGATELGVRFGAVVFSTLSSYMIYLLGKELFGSEKVGFWSAVLVNIIPLFSIGAILMTTDSLLLFFWAGAVYSVKRALDGDSKWWYAAGAFIGFGFLGKYTAVLLYPCIALYLVFSAQKRFWFKRVEPYLAGLISLVIATPVIFWNIKHGQVTIKHTMGQAGAVEAGLSIKPFFEFLGSQALLLTPLVFIAFAYGAVWCAVKGFGGKKDGVWLAFFTSAPVFLFFLFKSLHGKVQGNWAVASYVAAVPASVWAVMVLYEGSGKKAVKTLIAIGAVMAFIVSVLAYFPWPLEAVGARKLISGPPYNRVTGWKALGEAVSGIKKEMDSRPSFVMSDTYQIASELAFYMDGNPAVYNVDTGSRRMNQYDLWPGFEALTGHNALYIKGGVADAEPVVKEAFDGCERQIIKITVREGITKEFSAFRCVNFKGMEKAGDTTRY